LTELSSALLGLLGDVPGVAVDGVLPLWFHWPEPVEPDAPEPDAPEPEVLEPEVLEPEVPEPEVLEPEVPELVAPLPDVAPEPVAELSPMPLESVPVVLQAARPKHRAAAKNALVMFALVMMNSFLGELMGDSSVDPSIGWSGTAFRYPVKKPVSKKGKHDFQPCVD
jgi:hypothetical protein